MCTSVFVISLIFIVSALGCDENDARIRFYHDSMENYTELCMDEAEEIFSTSWYNPKLKTVFFTHGFTGHTDGPAITGIVNTYLSLGTYNVALVNWEKQAALAFPSIITSYIYWAVPNSIKVGGELSKAMLRLSAAGLDMNNTHLVGLSLGAHLIGIAGSNLTENGIQVGCIIGLDPAVGFESRHPSLRLSSTSARFVTVIHSDPNKFGTRRNMGVVDFWPNPTGMGPVVQPGCPRKAQKFSDEEFCSHNRSWKFFAEVLLNPGTMLGSHAKNFKQWTKYNAKQRKATVLEVGLCDENAVPGNYYFTTAAESPYGLGEKGL